MRERDIERHLVQRVQALGGVVRKVQWVGRRGAPDRRIALPQLRDGFPCWVELKAPGVEPEPHQLREHKRMRRVGEIVHVIDSIEAVEALLS